MGGTQLTDAEDPEKVLDQRQKSIHSMWHINADKLQWHS